ncbi:hypothetical protein JST97_37490 [bacterium]|nr:hypothetical protein [bacterium]
MEPELLQADQFDPSDQGQMAWNTSLNQRDLEYSEDGRTARWRELPTEGIAPRLWTPVQSLAHLHSGSYRWDFAIQDLGQAQIGVGFMLAWNIGPDWGFYGYLGSSSSAWAYDPTSGDVVINTRSIQGGLPRLQSGLITVQLHLPRQGTNYARFLVQGVGSEPVELPPASVVVPAACLLGFNQRVTLGELIREDGSWAPKPQATIAPPRTGGLLSRLRGLFKRT